MANDPFKYIFRFCCDPGFNDQEEIEALMDYVYDIMGAGLPSADVAGAVFAIFFTAGEDVWKAIRLGAGLGGDTDTIAALAAALCAAFAGGKLNIPSEITEAVFAANPVLSGAPWEN